MSMEKATENSGLLDGRDYTAAFLYEFFSLLVGNGVYEGELEPSATNENMTITHGSGHAWINGVCYKNTTPFSLDIDTADGSLNRYDSLMLRLDLSNNETYAIVIRGDYATEPTPPDVTRNAETYDLKICDIYVPAGCTKITQAQITDRRLDTTVCGVPVFPVKHLDMETFYRQIVNDLASFRQKEQANFAAWVEEQEESHLATMGDLVEIVRKTSDDSVSEILELLRQLNQLVGSDTVGELITEINGKLQKSGGTMTGDIEMSGNRITGMGTPEEAGDGATKDYVDGKHFIATVSLPASGWSGSAPYTQTVAVDGILETDRPHYGVVYAGNAAEKADQKEGFALVDDLDTGAGSVTFTCFGEAPGVDLTLQLEVNR